MESRLNILLLEDNSDDAELIERELRAAKMNFSLTHVDERTALIAQIKQSHWDIVLADYSLPQFAGLEVLDCLRQEALDVPVILVTGGLNERLASDVVQPGVEDFILKDRLNRLPLAIRKAVERKSLERQRQKTQIELEQSREQLRALTAKLHAAREAESIRIAREIHDEFGQGLTGLKLHLSQIRSQLPSTEPSVARRLDGIEKTIAELMRSAHRIATELRPRSLDDLGLGAAIRGYVRNFEEISGLECRYESNVPDKRFPEQISTALFRILQEALTNVGRHARASHVEIRFTEEQGNLMLEVQDDGKGIANTALVSPGAMGLLGMRERVRLLQGSCKIDRGEGRGTRLLVTIPNVGPTSAHDARAASR